MKDLYRSMLFTPGDKPERMKKALRSDADALIFDLEDGVALTHKQVARENVYGLLEEKRRLKVYVRVNSCDTGFWREDIEAVVSGGADGIMLPKAEDPREIRLLDELIGEYEETYSKTSVDLIPLVESARGVIFAFDIAASSPRISRIAFGALDYTLDIGTSFTVDGSEVFYARSHLVNASRAAGILPPVDTVFPDLNDAVGYSQDLKTARQLGMFGKLIIHPRQLKPANQVFSPSGEDIDYARQILDYLAENETAAKGVFQMDGKMVDLPVISRARQIIRLANKFNLEKEEGSNGQITGKLK